MLNYKINVSLQTTNWKFKGKQILVHRKYSHLIYRQLKQTQPCYERMTDFWDWTSVKKKERRKTLTELIKVGTDLSLIETTAKFVKYVFRVPVVDFKVKRADMLFEWTSHLYQASTIWNLRKTSYEYGGILTFAMVTISLFVFKRM